MADLFHTFFGISGLSLLGYFKNIGGEILQNSDTSGVDSNEVCGEMNEEKTNKISNSNDQQNSNKYAKYRAIDPTYALPKDIVEKMNLTRQKLTEV